MRKFHQIRLFELLSYFLSFLSKNNHTPGNRKKESKNYGLNSQVSLAFCVVVPTLALLTLGVLTLNIFKPDGSSNLICEERSLEIKFKSFVYKLIIHSKC